MDTDGLRLFVLAAEKLNISAAGRDLGMVPAVSSAKLAKLEKRLGVQLLHRSTRKVSLSIEGSDFLPFAREMLAQEEAAYDALGHGRSEPQGTIRFAAPSSFAQLHLMPVIPIFQERYPHIALDLRLSDTQFDLIDGSFDLALRNQALTDSSLRARKLADDRRLLVASPDYLKRHGTPNTPEDLSHHKLIGFQGASARKLVGDNGQEGWFDPMAADCKLVVDDGSSQKLATVAGAGISANSMWSVYDRLVTGELVKVLPDYEVQDKVSLWLVYPKTNVLTAKVRVLIDFLISEVGERRLVFEG